MTSSTFLSRISLFYSMLESHPRELVITESIGTGDRNKRQNSSRHRDRFHMLNSILLINHKACLNFDCTKVQSIWHLYRMEHRLVQVSLITLVEPICSSKLKWAVLYQSGDREWQRLPKAITKPSLEFANTLFKFKHNKELFIMCKIQVELSLLKQTVDVFLLRHIKMSVFIQRNLLFWFREILNSFCGYATRWLGKSFISKWQW